MGVGWVRMKGLEERLGYVSVRCGYLVKQKKRWLERKIWYVGNF